LQIEPYIEARDNLLSILSSIQIFIVLLIALVMKRRDVDAGSDENGASSTSFDDKYLGYVLMSLSVLLFEVFFLSGFVAQCVKRTGPREVDGLGRTSETRARANTGVYDIFSGLRVSLGWERDRPLAINDGQSSIELGNIYSGGEDGNGLSANPIHNIPGESVERPSGGEQFPPLEFDRSNGMAKQDDRSNNTEKTTEKSLSRQVARSVSGGYLSSAKGSKTKGGGTLAKNRAGAASVSKPEVNKEEEVTTKTPLEIEEVTITGEGGGGKESRWRTD